MGRLSHEPHVNHFSHPHRLELLSMQVLTPRTPPCAACKTPLQGWVYACRQCIFNIHASCSQLPQHITHPSHPSHILVLLPVPTYPGGLFSCDACALRGTGFSYHCSVCDFDLHALCASKPLVTSHASHPHHLTLAFTPPYDTKGFSCDICRKVGINQWLYRCGPCGFDAHIACVSSANGVAPQLQHQTSLPVPHTAQHHGQNLQHANSFPLTNNEPAVIQGPGAFNQNQGSMTNTGFQNNAFGSNVPNANPGADGRQSYNIGPNGPVDTVSGFDIQGIVQGVALEDVGVDGGSDSSTVTSSVSGEETFAASVAASAGAQSNNNNMGPAIPNQYPAVTGAPANPTLYASVGVPGGPQPGVPPQYAAINGSANASLYSQAGGASMPEEYAAAGGPQGFPNQNVQQGRPNNQNQFLQQSIQPQYGMQTDPNANGNTLMNAVVQAFVQGAAEQVGQNFVQSIMGGGDGGGGSGNDGNLDAGGGIGGGGFDAGGGFE